MFCNTGIKLAFTLVGLVIATLKTLQTKQKTSIVLIYNISALNYSYINETCFLPFSCYLELNFFLFTNTVIISHIQHTQMVVFPTHLTCRFPYPTSRNKMA